ncbi:DUF58 domain-containing protein [Aliivibrio kagoshimensis]|uniref:DUF58 domain-containing protein n=1 Tax=Aliivibrio kagoshimensis TaxID=2910230 RepID=UPI003D0D73D4
MSESLTLPTHSDGLHLCLAELLLYKNQTIHWLPPSKSVWSQLNGQHISRSKGRGMNFSEVRQYQAGDDIRSIDWRVTARTGKTHTKLFTEEREQPVMLFIDISSSMRFGSKLLLKSVQAAHFASLISWLAVKQNDRVGAIIYTGEALIECKPTARQQGPLNIINQLVTLHNNPIDTELTKLIPLVDAFKHLHQLCPKGSEIVMISDFHLLHQEHKVILSKIRHHNRLQLVSISDALERGQTQFTGSITVNDNAARRTAWLDFGNKRTKQLLNSSFQHRHQFITDLSRSLGSPFYQLYADLPLLDQLRATTPAHLRQEA